MRFPTRQDGIENLDEVYFILLLWKYLSPTDLTK